MRSEVYTWRLSAQLKSDLEQEARARNVSVSVLLDMAARDWLKTKATRDSDEKEQRALHAAAENCLGTLASGNPRRSETARKLIRERLTRRHAS